MSRRSRIKRNPEKFFAKYGKKFSELFPGTEKLLEALSNVTTEEVGQGLKEAFETLNKEPQENPSSPEETTPEPEVVEEKPKTRRRTRKTSSSTTKKTTRKTSPTTKKATTTRKPRTRKTKKEE